ncbi:MAG: hypothetical protein U1A78_09565 [Polyangia bacterium]
MKEQRSPRPSTTRAVVALSIGLSLLGGCAGQLRATVGEHAASTLTVAETLRKAAAMIKCDAMAADAAAQKESCSAAVSTILDQAKALSDGADQLKRAAR